MIEVLVGSSSSELNQKPKIS